MPQPENTGENNPTQEPTQEQQRPRDERRGSRRPRQSQNQSGSSSNGQSNNQGRPRRPRQSSGQPRNNARTGTSDQQRSQNQPAQAGQQSPRRGRPGSNQARSQNQPQGGDRQRNRRPRPAGDQPRSPAPGQPQAGNGSQPNQNGSNGSMDNRPAGNRPRRGSGSNSQQRQNPRKNTRTGSRPSTPQNGRSGTRQGSSPTGRLQDRELFVPSIPRKAHGGIKARSSEGGEFGKNWWAKRWLLAMERLMDGARLQRGRRYARMGQVLSMNEVEGEVVAKVQGSRPQPYKVTIRVEPFSDEQWEKVLDVLADQAIFTAQLLAGEMPPTIEDSFAAADVSLFPARGGELITECSCPDWANPCKHIAATHYILGDRFDEDPFLIFRLRGRSQEQILQALRQRRAGAGEVEVEVEEPEEEVIPLDQDLAHFWDIGPGLENFAVNVQRPAIALPLLKRLGEPDIARKYPLEDQLGPAYEAISQAALILAYSDMTQVASDNGSESS